MSSYTEVSPLISSSRSYVKIGLGGAGNYVPTERKNHAPFPAPPRASVSHSAASHSGSIGARNHVSPKRKNTAPFPLPPQSTATHTGRGGAGNCLHSTDRILLSAAEFEKYESLRIMMRAKSWHHGIGGAGNRTSSEDDACSEVTLASSSDSSKSSENWERKGAANRLKGLIGEKWEKRNQGKNFFQAWQRK